MYSCVEMNQYCVLILIKAFPKITMYHTKLALGNYLGCPYSLNSCVYSHVTNAMYDVIHV